MLASYSTIVVSSDNVTFTFRKFLIKNFRPYEILFETTSGLNDLFFFRLASYMS